MYTGGRLGKKQAPPKRRSTACASTCRGNATSRDRSRRDWIRRSVVYALEKALGNIDDIAGLQHDILFFFASLGNGGDLDRKGFALAPGVSYHARAIRRGDRREASCQRDRLQDAQL